MIILDLLATSAKKCHWLQPRYIKTPRIKSRFGNYLLKLVYITGNPSFVYTSMYNEIIPGHHDQLIKMFMLWLSDISGFHGKRGFLKECGNVGGQIRRGERKILAMSTRMNHKI
jgi:hypothetical protein